MSSALRFHKLFPKNKRNQYGALENIDFDVRIGEIHSLVGENGAGKSTLMNILNGSIREDSGEIFLKNKLIKIKNPHIAKQLGISMVHQELKLIPELTVAENIFFGRQSKHFFVNWGNLFRKTDKVESYFGFALSEEDLLTYYNQKESDFKNV